MRTKIIEDASSDASWYHRQQCSCTTGHWCSQHKYLLDRKVQESKTGDNR